MGIREGLNKRPRLAAGLGVAFLVVSVALLVATNRGAPGRVTQAYYTVDGKTFFADDIDKIYPFDQGGKPAYRAYVYQCSGGDPFVAYMARYSDGAKKRIAELSAKSGDPEAQGQVVQLRNAAIEVKRPNDAKWVPVFSAPGGEIASHPQCKEGGVAKPVNP